MGHDLEAPGTDPNPDWDSLYLYRGAEVVDNRPVFTGDIYQDVEVTGEASPKTVIILQHPSAIHGGVNLLNRILVAEVIVCADGAIKPSLWVRKYFKHLPLARLMPDSDTPHWIARFDYHYIVTREQLQSSTRIACFDQVGVNLLMQRWVKHNTRVVVPTQNYQEMSLGQYEEADIIENWRTDQVDDGWDVVVATSQIDEWLSAPRNPGEKTRRDLLANDQLHGSLRREMLAYRASLNKPPD